MMKRFHMDDGDGKIDRHEFVLLCVVRMGALSPEFIGTIYKRFEELDADGSGSLDYHEILEKKKEDPPAVKRASTPGTSSTLPSFLQSDVESGTDDRKSKRKSNTTKSADSPLHEKGDSPAKARGTQLRKAERASLKKQNSNNEDGRSSIL